MKILYCGDSAVGGPANYLLGILRHLKASVVHIPPDQKLNPKILNQKFDVIIFSDYSRQKVSAAVEQKILAQIESGTGFLMIGGWASFSGPFGGWHGSQIEKILPISCLAKDDRISFPGGALIAVKHAHSMFDGLSFKNPPAVMGANDIRAKKNGQVLLTVRKIISVGNHLMLDPAEHPFLVIDSDPRKRIAALATDLAPHWCGGMVDWGCTTRKLPVRGKIFIEVGDAYIRFVSSLIRWLANAR